MLFIEIAISLAICIGLSAGSMVTAQSEMMALNKTRTLQFYTQDIPTTNLIIQKLVSKAASFNIYGDLGDATLGYPGGASGLTNSAGTVVRLNFAAPTTTPNIYPVGFLCSYSNDGVYYFATTSSTPNGTGVIDPGSTSVPLAGCWKIAGWANNSYGTPPTSPASTSGPFNCLFSVSDPLDPNAPSTGSGNAAGLLVVNLMENNRAVTLYAERF